MSGRLSCPKCHQPFEAAFSSDVCPNCGAPLAGATSRPDETQASWPRDVDMAHATDGGLDSPTLPPSDQNPDVAGGDNEATLRRTTRLPRLHP